MFFCVCMGGGGGEGGRGGQGFVVTSINVCSKQPIVYLTTYVHMYTIITCMIHVPGYSNYIQSCTCITYMYMYTNYVRYLCHEQKYTTQLGICIMS